MARASSSERIFFVAVWNVKKKTFNDSFLPSTRIDEKESERTERLAKWDNYLKEEDDGDEKKKEEKQVEEQKPEESAEEDVSKAEKDSEEK